jgi:hypothetical protein
MRIGEIFELYVPGENPMDALVSATAIADKDTKSVTVNVSNLELKS